MIKPRKPKKPKKPHRYGKPKNFKMKRITFDLSSPSGFSISELAKSLERSISNVPNKIDEAIDINEVSLSYSNFRRWVCYNIKVEDPNYISNLKIYNEQTEGERLRYENSMKIYTEKLETWQKEDTLYQRWLKTEKLKKNKEERESLEKELKSINSKAAELGIRQLENGDDIRGRHTRQI